MVSFNPFAYFNLPTDFVGTFLKSQFTNLPYPTHDFSGQTIIVTGANIGLGLEAARHFVRLSASRVIIACRSLEKGEAAKRDIEETTQTNNVVEVWQVDLSSYASIKEFCQRADKLERLDAVVENAGVATPYFELVEGMENTITVNVIGTFLMALLLLPKLRDSGGKFNMVPRLTIVASDAHEQARFKEQFEDSIFEALKDPKYQFDRYNVSKLLEILVVRELGPAIGNGVLINAVNPGFCLSELMRHAVFPLNFLGWIGKKLIARTTEVGSRNLVFGTIAGLESSGAYMYDCIVHDPSRWVRSDQGLQAQKRVYAELLGVLEEIEPGVTKNI